MVLFYVPLYVKEALKRGTAEMPHVKAGRKARENDLVSKLQKISARFDQMQAERLKRSRGSTTPGQGSQLQADSAQRQMSFEEQKRELISKGIQLPVDKQDRFDFVPKRLAPKAVMTKYLNVKQRLEAINQAAIAKAEKEKRDLSMR